MKIYTKTGDLGKTGLFGKDRVSKNAIRVHAYGEVDELNAWVGLLGDHLPHVELLRKVQDCLFTVGSNLATVDEKYLAKIPKIVEEDVEELERQMDEMSDVLPKMTHFILPGGHSTISFIHLARTVCRRAERSMVHLAEEESVEPILLKYMNRLSDFLFVLSRKTALDLQVEEIKWVPKK